MLCQCPTGFARHPSVNALHVSAGTTFPSPHTSKLSFPGTPNPSILSLSPLLLVPRKPTQLARSVRQLSATPAFSSPADHTSRSLCRAHRPTPSQTVDIEDSLQFLAKCCLLLFARSALPSTRELSVPLEPGNFLPVWGISTVQQLGIERFLQVQINGILYSRTTHVYSAL